VNEAAILGGHFHATGERFAATSGPILVLHDTTEFSYTRGPREAIHVDLAEHAVLQPPSDDTFDRIEHLVPGSAKALCGFFPLKAAHPTG
jgi:hypothetical protein